MLTNIFIHETAIVDEGAQIGDGTKVWHFSHIMANAHIGAHCTLGQNVFVGNAVKVGDNCKIQNNVSLYTGVHLHNDVFVGPSAVFTNVVNPRSTIDRKSEFKETTVHSGASIGANATIICGCKIGAFAFIGAGAVVTKDVAPFALIAGVPGKQIGWVSKCGHRLTFENNLARCPQDGSHYNLKDNQVTLINE